MSHTKLSKFFLITSLFFLVSASTVHGQPSRFWNRLAKLVTNCSDITTEQAEIKRVGFSESYDLAQSIADDFELKNQSYVDEMESQNIDVKHQWKNDVLRFLLRRNDGSGWFPESRINSNLLAKYPRMNPKEVNTIFAYIRTGPRLNRFLRYPEGLSTVEQSYYRGYALTLEHALDKVPEFDKDIILYRGIRGIEADEAKTWQIGDVIEFKEYKSTSEDKSITERFAKMENEYLYYEISDPIGYDISDFYEPTSAPETNSSMATEVLIRPMSRFEVLDVTTEINEKGSLEITYKLKQLPYEDLSIIDDLLTQTDPNSSSSISSLSQQNLIKLMVEQ